MWCRSEVSRLLPASDRVGDRGRPMGATLSFVTGDSHLPDPAEQMPGGWGRARAAPATDRRYGTVTLPRRQGWSGHGSTPSGNAPHPVAFGGGLSAAEWVMAERNDPAGPGLAC